MKDQTLKLVRLGAFVLVGTVCLILGLYYIGSQKNIFHSSITVSSDFSDVDGLMKGNNVRFNGINVGTISKVYAIADTAIKVEFTIDVKATQFINKNTIASIGTDGLLGNKLINLSPGKYVAEPVQEGDLLRAVDPIKMDKELRTITMTNDNLKVITENLRGITEKFNADNSLWHLLSDSLLADNVKSAIVSFKLTGTNTATLTGDLSKIVRDVKSGKGTFGAFLTDTTLSKRIGQTIVNIQAISDSVALISGDFKAVSGRLKNGEGSIGTLLTDTTFVHNLNKSMENIKDGSKNFNENMEALKHTWPLKKYFKKNK